LGIGARQAGCTQHPGKNYCDCAKSEGFAKILHGHPVLIAVPDSCSILEAREFYSTLLTFPLVSVTFMSL
jgi:hypothetical protein